MNPWGCELIFSSSSVVSSMREMSLIFLWSECTGKGPKSGYKFWSRASCALLKCLRDLWAAILLGSTSSLEGPPFLDLILLVAASPGKVSSCMYIDKTTSFISKNKKERK